jgi:TolA-binding protein
VWGILLGHPEQGIAGAGLTIDKTGQAVVYPCSDLLGKDAGTIEFNVTAGVVDGADHVLLDSWGAQGNSRIRLVYRAAKLSLSVINDAGVETPVSGAFMLAQGSSTRVAVLYDGSDITLTVNGAPVGTTPSPKLPSSEPLALVIGNDRGLALPSKFAFSGLRLSTGKSTAAGSLPVPAVRTADEQQLDVTLAYQRRLNPLIDKLRPTLPGVASYVAASAALDVQDYPRALAAIAPLTANPVDPLYAAAIMLQAQVLRGQKDYSGAFDKLEILANSRDTSVSIRAQLAQASLLHEQGGVDEAKRIISDLIARYHDQPELAEAYLMIANDLALKGDWQGVLTSTQQITGGGSEKNVPIGQPIEIRIADTDLATRPSDTGLPVTVTASSGDKEQIVLRPAFSKGVYFGSIPTELGEPKAGDRKLQVVGGAKVKIDYIDRISSDGANAPRSITIGLATEAKVSVMAQAAMAVYKEVVLYQKQNLLDDNWTVIGDLPSTASDFFRDADDGSLRKKGSRFDKSFLSTIRPGQSVYIELDEPDLDTTIAADKAVVDVRSATRKMSVTLTETGPHTGIFGGTVKTALAGQPADGILTVAMNDVISAQYVNPRAGLVRPSRLAQADNSVRVATTAGTLSVGTLLTSGDGDKQFVRAWRISRDTPVVVEVDDRDLDTSDAADTATVHLQSSGGGSADLKLTETGGHTGVFTGSLPILGVASATAKVGIKAAPGDIIVATYHDDENPSGKPADVTAQFKVNIAEDATFSLERQVVDASASKGAPTLAPTVTTTWVATKTLVPGSVYRATLSDPDVVPSTTGDFKSYVLLKSTSGATVEVPLESKPDEANSRNVFQGQFFVRLGDSTSATKAYFSQTGAPVKISEDTDLYKLASMPALNVLGDSSVNASYTEPLTADARRSVARVWPLRIGFDATVAALNDREIPIDTVKPGMPFTLQIEDATADRTAKRDTIRATITSSSGTVLLVTLSETDTHSGLFAVDVATSSTAVAPGPAVLGPVSLSKPVGPAVVPFGGKLTVTYQNASTESGAPAVRQLVLPANPIAEASAIMLSKVFDDPKFEAEALVRLGESLYAVGAAKLATTETTSGTARTNAELQQAAKLLEDVATRFRGSEYTVEALYLTAKIRREEHRYEDAQRLLDRVVQDYPDSGIVAQALYQQVQLQYDRGDIDLATEAAMHLAHAFPTDPLVMDAFLKVAEYYYTKKQFAKAASIYYRAIDRFPDSPKVPLVAYRAATTFYKAGIAGDETMFAKAVKAYIDFASRYRDSEYADAAMYWAAIASEKTKDERKAYTILTKLLIMYPGSDMKGYAVRERDKLKELYPDIRADDEL